MSKKKSVAVLPPKVEASLDANNLPMDRCLHCKTPFIKPRTSEWTGFCSLRCQKIVIGEPVEQTYRSKGPEIVPAMKQLSMPKIAPNPPKQGMCDCGESGKVGDVCEMCGGKFA